MTHGTCDCKVCAATAAWNAKSDAELAALCMELLPEGMTVDEAMQRCFDAMVRTHFMLAFVSATMMALASPKSISLIAKLRTDAETAAKMGLGFAIRAAQGMRADGRDHAMDN